MSSGAPNRSNIGIPIPASRKSGLLTTSKLTLVYRLDDENELVLMLDKDEALVEIEDADDPLSEEDDSLLAD